MEWKGGLGLSSVVPYAKDPGGHCLLGQEEGATKGVARRHTRRCRLVGLA